LKGDIKKFIELLSYFGKISHTGNVSDEIEETFSINLIPDQSVVSSFHINQLQEIMSPNKVGIWFFYNIDMNRNECHIDIDILRTQK